MENMTHPQKTGESTRKPVIEVEGLTKSYENFVAVNDLTFQVGYGEIVGLVGANGAGKTTTLRSLCGILRPSAGTVRIGGFDIQQDAVNAKRQLAYIPDTSHPFDMLTVLEHLHFVALAYRVANARQKSEELLDELELKEKRDEMASSLSRGMLQKLSLACAFLRSPAVIIMDEPLTGLDPRGIRNIKDSIRRRAATGTAFFLSSHLLELVEKVCDRILILHKGSRVAFGSLEEVRMSAASQTTASLEEVFFNIIESRAGEQVSKEA
jgi:ABC-2 type transport system ATP-binding protein